MPRRRSIDLTDSTAASSRKRKLPRTFTTDANILFEDILEILETSERVRLRNEEEEAQRKKRSTFMVNPFPDSTDSLSSADSDLTSSISDEAEEDWMLALTEGFDDNYNQYVATHYTSSMSSSSSSLYTPSNSMMEDQDLVYTVLQAFLLDNQEDDQP